MPTNGKKCQKIANNCKISEITKYGEKMTQIDRNVKNAKNGQNGQIKKKMSSFFWLKTTSKNGTSHIDTMFGSRDTHSRSFLAKIRIFRSKFQPNQRNYS